MHIDVMEVNAYVALSFVSCLIQAKLSSALVSKVLAGVSFFLKFASLPPLTSFFQVSQVLKVFRKSCPALDSRCPISDSLLVKLLAVLEVVCFSQFELLLYRAAFTVAFFGALRIGEFTAPNRLATSFLFPHISLERYCLNLFICRSKTHCLGKGQCITLGKSPNPIVCPVTHVGRYLLARPLYNDSFFIHQDLSPFTRYEFSAGLSSCFKCLNLSGL